MKADIIQLGRTSEFFMGEAYKEANLALEKGEVPIGAVIVSNNKIIARSHNQTEQLNDVTAHAEMIAITSAANHLGNKYLKECDIYITIEPCGMCAGALNWAQIRKVFYGAPDPKKGFLNNVSCKLHPKTQVESGILDEKCSKILSDFFTRLRS